MPETNQLRVLEFFAGIGGLHYALRRSGIGHHVVRAYDVDDMAVRVYRQNLPETPVSTANIRSLKSTELAALKADCWVLSPPCQPYTRQGLQLAGSDKRAEALTHLIDLLEHGEPEGLRPSALLLENVVGFESSAMRARLCSVLESAGYCVREVWASPAHVGVPNQRSRYFLLARRGGPGALPTSLPPSLSHATLLDPQRLATACAAGGEALAAPRGEVDEAVRGACAPLAAYLEPPGAVSLEGLDVPEHVLERYGGAMDLTCRASRRSCCFTKNYARYVKGTGSVLCEGVGSGSGGGGEAEGGDAISTTVLPTRAEDKTLDTLRPLRVRYFHPRELLRLHGFPGEDEFVFPPEVKRKKQFELVGNSLSVQVVSALLKLLLAPHDASHAAAGGTASSSVSLDGLIAPPLLSALREKHPALWENPQLVRLEELPSPLPLSLQQLDAARATWEWLRPLLAHLFDDARQPPWGAAGTVSSALRRTDALGGALGLPAGRLFVKEDSQLAVCGSVKARGGLFEVMSHARSIAHATRGSSGDGSPAPLASMDLATDPAIRAALATHEVAVGSTGNLGLSVGLAAAALGMRATVHMSTDAKQWKKDLLGARGATVVEHSGPYGEAVAAGRAASDADPRSHFVDDEQSTSLFLGYAAAAYELRAQLDDASVLVSEEAPLVVHIPCGVGGAPGGLCWGLHHAFPSGSVKVFFAEPTGAPCVTLALASGQGAAVCVADAGLDGKTEADGLAVGRASPLCVRMVQHLVAGCYTVDDSELFQHLAQLVDLEGDDAFIEPSCCAALSGPARLRASEAGRALLDKGTHVVWATGGALVPAEQREAFVARGR